jgi:2-polyprenyl-3-methyl-5-hydroxy-6-metoxy-1,4-benzoquinol methylase
MVYANPVDEELASGQFYDRLGVPFYLSPDKLESDYAPVRFTRELRLFRRFCPAGRVLDVGCSTGGFLFQLKSLGYEATGTDVSGPALDYAEQRGLHVVRTPFLEQTWDPGTFDAVTFWAVLEHVLEPRLFLQRAADLLKPGGHGFVLVPNWRSLAVRLLGPHYRYVLPDHVNYFSAATLRALAAIEPRFVEVSLCFTHFNPIVLWQDWCRGDHSRVPDAERAQLLQRTTALKQNPWLAPAKGLYAGIEKVLGTVRLADNLVLVLRRQ